MTSGGTPDRSNVLNLFVLDERLFAQLERRIRKMGLAAPELLKLLNTKEAMPNAGDALMLKGVVSFAAAIGVCIAFNGFLEYAWTAAATIGGGGIGFVSRGFKEKLVRRDIHRRAIKARDALERDDGVLWRFEPLLKAGNNTLSDTVAGTLRPICQSSKDGTLGSDWTELRAYWFWMCGTLNIVRDQAIYETLRR